MPTPTECSLLWPINIQHVSKIARKEIKIKYFISSIQSRRSKLKLEKVPSSYCHSFGPATVFYRQHVYNELPGNNLPCYCTADSWSRKKFAFLRVMIFHFPPPINSHYIVLKNIVDTSLLCVSSSLSLFFNLPGRGNVLGLLLQWWLYSNGLAFFSNQPHQSKFRCFTKIA